MTNYLFLDIDGVLNAPLAKLNHSTAWPEYRYAQRKPGYTYGEIVAPEMINQLNQLIKEHDVTVVWLTTWEEEAPDFGQRIGLNEATGWEWLDTGDRNGNWGKWESIKTYLNNYRQKHDHIAWLDDDLVDEHDASLWAAKNNILAIAPTNTHGITPAHLQQLQNHYRKNQQ